MFTISRTRNHDSEKFCSEQTKMPLVTEMLANATGLDSQDEMPASTTRPLVGGGFIAKRKDRLEP
jgi:hypothetical protein